MGYLVQSESPRSVVREIAFHEVEAVSLTVPSCNRVDCTPRSIALELPARDPPGPELADPPETQAPNTGDGTIYPKYLAAKW